MTTFLAPFRTVCLGIALGLGLVSCQSQPAPESTPLIQHEADASVLTLEREASGPYLEGATERFRAGWPAEDISRVRWSASGGKLRTSGEWATWTLPSSGVASLTATVVKLSGEEVSGTWNFQVASPSASVGSTSPGDEGAAGLIAAPVAVDTTNESTGYVCELAFDTAGNGHLLYNNDTHSSLWYGSWNGTAWTTQQVDGQGFGTGGAVYSNISLAVNGDGTPHLLYEQTGRGLVYATRVSGNWVRETVPGPVPYGTIAITLDPTQGNRPVAVWHSYVSTSSGNLNRIYYSTRTGTNNWVTTQVVYSSSSDDVLAGEVVIDPNTGTLFIPTNGSELITVKGSSVQHIDFETAAFGDFTYGSNSRVALTVAGTNRLLIRSANGIFDVGVGFPLSLSTLKVSPIETASVYTGDIVFAGGKPYVLHLHDSSLELVTTGTGNYWSYTQLGSSSSARIGIAVRPTTGQPHICYRYANKVMFQ